MFGTLMKVIDDDAKERRRLKRERSTQRRLERRQRRIERRQRRQVNKLLSFFTGWNRKKPNRNDAEQQRTASQQERRMMHNEKKAELVGKLEHLDSSKILHHRRSKSFNILEMLGDESISYGPSSFSNPTPDDENDVEYIVRNSVDGELNNGTDHAVKRHSMVQDDDVDSTSGGSLPVDQKIYEWTKHRLTEPSLAFSTRSILKSSSALHMNDDSHNGFSRFRLSSKPTNSVRFLDDVSSLSSFGRRNSVINKKDESENGIGSLDKIIKETKRKPTIEWNNNGNERRGSIPSLVESSTETPAIPKPKSILQQKRQVSKQEQNLRSISKYTFFRRLCDNVFHTVDRDHIGAIDEKEFYNGLLLLQIHLGIFFGPAACIRPITKEKAHRIFGKFDHDRTGVIDQIDFREVMVVLLRYTVKQLIIQVILSIMLLPIVTFFILDTVRGPALMAMQLLTTMYNALYGTDDATDASLADSCPNYYQQHPQQHQPNIVQFVGLFIRIFVKILHFMIPSNVKRKMPLIATSIIVGMWFIPYIHVNINEILFPPTKKLKFRSHPKTIRID